jgi:outer membrane protein assembly factor BamB
MTECGRRRLLQGVGIAVCGGVLASGAASASGIDAESGAGDWPSPRGNPGNTGYILDADGPGASAAAAWEYDHGGPVAVADGIVYLTVDGEVHALDAESGDPVGRTDDVGASGGPTVTDDAVYVGGEQLTAIDLASGEAGWAAGVDRDSVSTPTVSDGVVVVVTDGALYAVDADDGDDLWRFAPDDPLPDQQPSVADGAAFVTDGETLYGVDLDDGSERWTADGSFEAGAIMATGRTIFAQLDDETGVYSTETGQGIWANPGTPALTTDGTHANVYTRSDDAIVGYRRNTGEEFWRTPDGMTAVSLPVASGPIIYVGIEHESAGTGIAAFDVEEDEIEWFVETDAQPESLAVAGDAVYASADDLVAIQADDADDEFDGDADNETDENETDAADESGEDDAGDETPDEDANETDDTDADADDADPDDADGEDDDGDEPDDADDESTPGFTVGAGIAGGAVALEWLRRRGAADDEA